MNTSEEQPGLEIVALPGGIWGNFFNDCLAKNFLFLTPDGGATVNAVEAEVSFAPRAWGEQAGIFWHSDDNNYAKFVVEGMKDGSVALVFALEINGSPRVVKKLPWEGSFVRLTNVVYFLSSSVLSLMKGLGGAGGQRRRQDARARGFCCFCLFVCFSCSTSDLICTEW